MFNASLDAHHTIYWNNFKTNYVLIYYNSYLKAISYLNSFTSLKDKIKELKFLPVMALDKKIHDVITLTFISQTISRFTKWQQHLMDALNSQP